jgi:hypothetical protein
MVYAFDGLFSLAKAQRTRRVRMPRKSFVNIVPLCETKGMSDVGDVLQQKSNRFEQSLLFQHCEILVCQ